MEIQVDRLLVSSGRRVGQDGEAERGPFLHYLLTTLTYQKGEKPCTDYSVQTTSFLLGLYTFSRAKNR